VLRDAKGFRKGIDIGSLGRVGESEGLSMSLVKSEQAYAMRHMHETCNHTDGHWLIS